MLELVTLPYLVTKRYKLAQKEKRFYMIPNFRLFGVFGLSPFLLLYTFLCNHRLRTSGEEIVVSARPTTKSQSQIFRYGQSLFCLPQRPKISDFFDLCLHWVSVVRGIDHLSAKVNKERKGLNNAIKKILCLNCEFRKYLGS